MRSSIRDTFNRTPLEVLQFELDFIQQGGYGRSVRTPKLARVPFLDSPTCLNFLEPTKMHPCDGCVLLDFVPVSERETSVPCHHIPLDDCGQTIAEAWDPNDETKAVEALEKWLRPTIDRLKAEQGVVVSEEKYCAET